MQTYDGVQECILQHALPEGLQVSLPQVTAELTPPLKKKVVK